ncbi:MAG: FGGY family carbohydrate kinase [Planctomycetota bacterium]
MAKSSKKSKGVAWGGFDLSTTGLGLGVRGSGGDEAYVHTKMRGATTWQGEPAFDVQQTPKMINTLLDQLEGEGWSVDRPSWSFAVRQHDMVVLDSEGQLLIPALSWQCNAATSQVQQLRRQGAEEVVGRVEERFILPKLMWALSTQRGLRESVARVMTTGDWVAAMLTGKARLSTSDALSNGLLAQDTKKLAADVIQEAKLEADWFPPVIQSGKVVGTVNARPVEGVNKAWMDVKQRLAGSKIVSSLGDNHATGVGCGLQEGDFETIVISAGTSGTINRVCRANVPLAGNAACFEYYKDRMLLMMLADCCKWYDRFVARYASDYADRMDELNTEIEGADLNGLRRVLHVDGKEVYPPDWDQLSVGQQAASTQLSIMLELLLLTRAMLAEVQTSRNPVSRYVLTGGLSQSAFFQQVFTAGVQLLNPKAKMLINARKGPLRYQTAAYGALLNAMRPTDKQAASRLCPTRNAARPSAADKKQLQYWLRAFGL